jgi:hypothetical protein
MMGILLGSLGVEDRPRLIEVYTITLPPSSTRNDGALDDTDSTISIDVESSTRRPDPLSGADLSDDLTGVEVSCIVTSVGDADT